MDLSKNGCSRPVHDLGPRYCATSCCTRSRSIVLLYMDRAVGFGTMGSFVGVGRKRPTLSQTTPRWCSLYCYSILPFLFRLIRLSHDGPGRVSEGLMGMKPSGTSLHKLAAQFVKHKRAGAPVCRPQTGRTKFASHKLGRPACSVSCPRGLAVSDPRSRGRSAAEAVQVPGERTPPYSSGSDA